MVARFHYDDTMLNRLLSNEPGDGMSEVLTHVESCETCQSKLESLSSGGMSWDEVNELMQSSGVPYQPANDTDCKLEVYTTLLEPTEHPDSLGRYEIMEFLGRGGMGIVMRGYDTALQRNSAVKVLAPELASSAAARKRFSREARSAAAVVHPHVVPIQNVDEHNGLPYLVMPVVEVKSLQQRIEREGPLSIIETVRIAAQVAEGLAAAHAQGLVHRDIKPANVLLENGVERVQITDFGLARAVDDASMTRSGVIAGTPQYMSPEQAHGDSIDHRSDLYSLGSVVYFMLTGRSPFRAETSMGVLNRICNDQPRPLRSINAEVPPWLATIVTRLLEKSPDDRFQSAEEVANLLTKHLTAMNNPEAGNVPALDDAESEDNRRNSALAEPPNRPRRILVAAGFAFVALAGILFYLQTDKGTLRIESNSDSDVPVRIMSGNETVEQLTVSKDGAITRLHAGDYVIEVDDADSHVEVKGDRFKLRRGDTWIVSVTPVTKFRGAGQEFEGDVQYFEPSPMAPSGGLMEGIGMAAGDPPPTRPPAVIGGEEEAGKPPTSTETERTNEHLNSLKQRARLLEERYVAGEASVDQSMRAWIEAAEAALPLATNAEDRIHNLRRQVKLQKELEKMLVQLHEAGEITSEKVLSARADRVKAEAGLSRELTERAEKVKAGAARESEESGARPAFDSRTTTPDDIEPNTAVPCDATSERSGGDPQAKNVPKFHPLGFDTPEALMKHISDCQSRNDVAGLVLCWTDDMVEQIATSYLMVAMMQIRDFEENPKASRPPHYAEHIQELRQILSDEIKDHAMAHAMTALALANEEASKKEEGDFSKSAEASAKSPLVRLLAQTTAELLKDPRRFVVRFWSCSRNFEESDKAQSNGEKFEYSIESRQRPDKSDGRNCAFAARKSDGHRMGLIETDQGWMVNELWPDAVGDDTSTGALMPSKTLSGASMHKPSEDIKRDWKTRLQGEWQVEMKGYDDDGKLQSSRAHGQVMGDHVTFTGDDGIPVSFAFEFGSEGPSEQVDIRPIVTPAEKEQLHAFWEFGEPSSDLINPVFPAIVENHESGFRFCIPNTPGQRPTGFAISTGLGMWILRRESGANSSANGPPVEMGLSMAAGTDMRSSESHHAVAQQRNIEWTSRDEVELGKAFADRLGLDDKKRKAVNRLLQQTWQSYIAVERNYTTYSPGHDDTLVVQVAASRDKIDPGKEVKSLRGELQVLRNRLLSKLNNLVDKRTAQAIHDAAVNRHSKEPDEEWLELLDAYPSVLGWADQDYPVNLELRFRRGKVDWWLEPGKHGVYGSGTTLPNELKHYLSFGLHAEQAVEQSSDHQDSSTSNGPYFEWQSVDDIVLSRTFANELGLNEEKQEAVSRLLATTWRSYVELERKCTTYSPRHDDEFRVTVAAPNEELARLRSRLLSSLKTLVDESSAGSIYARAVSREYQRLDDGSTASSDFNPSVLGWADEKYPVEIMFSFRRGRIGWFVEPNSYDAFGSGSRPALPNELKHYLSLGPYTDEISSGSTEGRAPAIASTADSPRVVSSASKFIAALEQVVQATHAKFEFGNATIDDVIDAKRRLLDARLKVASKADDRAIIKSALLDAMQLEKQLAEMASEERIMPNDARKAMVYRLELEARLDGEEQLPADWPPSETGSAEATSLSEPADSDVDDKRANNASILDRSEVPAANAIDAWANPDTASATRTGDSMNVSAGNTDSSNQVILEMTLSEKLPTPGGNKVLAEPTMVVTLGKPFSYHVGGALNTSNGGDGLEVGTQVRGTVKKHTGESFLVELKLAVGHGLIDAGNPEMELVNTQALELRITMRTGEEKQFDCGNSRTLKIRVQPITTTNVESETRQASPQPGKPSGVQKPSDLPDVIGKLKASGVSVVRFTPDSNITTKGF
ncbi:serine/threonine-protein kinase [Novipirellula rosea]|uniref:Protein kinase domain-containing protein n=1 Tax=Novipirellula rosea TaxID=1031540 RepID=A0ABP8MMZ9_9BACT